MNWKQPIPTNLEEVFGNDFLSQDIYIWTLLHAQNSNKIISLNGKIIQLERGQCYATLTYLASRFSKDPKTIKSHIILLHSLHNVLDYVIYPQGIVFTIKSYDDVIKLENASESNLDNDRVAIAERLPINKSDKSVKNDKTVANGFLTKLPRLITDKSRINYLVEEILNVTNDSHSTKFYELVASRIPEDKIRLTLSEIKADGARSPAKLFTWKIQKIALILKGGKA
jgi:hypothetical protein